MSALVDIALTISIQKDQCQRQYEAERQKSTARRAADRLDTLTAKRKEVILTVSEVEVNEGMIWFLARRQRKWNQEFYEFYLQRSLYSSLSVRLAVLKEIDQTRNASVSVLLVILSRIFDVYVWVNWENGWKVIPWSSSTISIWNISAGHYTIK